MIQIFRIEYKFELDPTYFPNGRSNMEYIKITPNPNRPSLSKHKEGEETDLVA